MTRTGRAPGGRPDAGGVSRVDTRVPLAGLEPGRRAFEFRVAAPRQVPLGPSFGRVGPPGAALSLRLIFRTLQKLRKAIGTNAVTLAYLK